MNRFKCRDIFPESGRRPVWGLETFVASDSSVHTSALFTPRSGGLIKGCEHTFNFCNQIVKPIMFILFSLKANPLHVRVREGNNKREYVRSLSCMGVYLSMNSMNIRRKMINKSNNYLIFQTEQKG